MSGRSVSVQREPSGHKTLSRHSELAKAFAYALNQWQALTYYAEDGWAEADNNIAENALRMVSLGRKTSCSSALTTEVSAEHYCTA
jgi:transposase